MRMHPTVFPARHAVPKRQCPRVGVGYLARLVHGKLSHPMGSQRTDLAEDFVARFASVPLVAERVFLRPKYLRGYELTEAQPTTNESTFMTFCQVLLRY